MSRAVVHIGAGKTGTTALQYWLTHNARRLDQLGFAYPDLPGASTRRDCINHNRLGYEILEPGMTRAKRAAATALRRLAGERDVTILSGEVLYARPYQADLAGPDAYLALKRASIERMMELLRPFERVEVVCYLRRHDRWFESLYNQLLKSGRAGAGTFDEFAAAYGRCHYQPQFDLWSQVVGQGQVTVRPYEQAQRREGCLFGDFARVLCLTESLPEPARSRRSVNPSLGRDFVEFARLARCLPLDRRSRARLRTGLAEVSARHLAAHPEPKSWSLFLSYDARVRLLDGFAADDAEVSRKYLSPEFDQLWDPPRPDENRGYPGLGAERAFEIAAQLIEYNRALGSPLRRRLRKLAGALRP